MSVPTRSVFFDGSNGARLWSIRLLPRVLITRACSLIHSAKWQNRKIREILTKSLEKAQKGLKKTQKSCRPPKINQPALNALLCDLHRRRLARRPAHHVHAADRAAWAVTDSTPECSGQRYSNARRMIASQRPHIMSLYPFSMRRLASALCPARGRSKDRPEQCLRPHMNPWLRHLHLFYPS